MVLRGDGPLPYRTGVLQSSGPDSNRFEGDEAVSNCCVEFCLYPRRSRGCAMRAKAERQRVQHRAIAWRGSRAR